MPSQSPHEYCVRNAEPAEFPLLGELTVSAYASLVGMPTVAEQPDYYEMLRDVGKRAANPAIAVFAAVSDAGEALGSVDFISDMKQYGSAGRATSISKAAGIRFLVVKPACRGRSIGRTLVAFCIDRARALGKSSVILHSTRAMATAWTLYERMGFERCADIDFQQGTMEVFGFRLPLGSGASDRDPGLLQ
jgi:ribosomal protein S18 acetylase RimI-like enzyme